MQLSDLLPTSEQLISIQGVERSLLQRRRSGTRLSTVLAFLGAVLQIVLIVGKLIPWPPVPNFTFSAKGIGQLLVSPEVVVVALFLAAAIVYTTIRYTGFLFKESKEPFRYTFDISSFTRIDATPTELCFLAREDHFKLLHVDLAQRLNRRIKRLSLLENSSKAGADADAANSGLNNHIHIEGEYAIREERAGGWVLQVLPKIRIGPESNPSTLAYAIRHPLSIRDATVELTADQFDQLTERVYSSIATEIYRQIKSDVENKIGMFPTDYLQAVARYCEARDFENSNTIDSYDRALELYRTSIHAFDVSAMGSVALRLTGHRWFRGWRWVRPALQAEARARLGYARCMIYRRIVSELAGRNQNPLFEIRGELQRARELVTRCYNSVMPSPELRFRSIGVSGPPSAEQIALNGILEFPDDRAFRARRMDTYHVLREELCETYAVSALGYSQLADAGSAQKFLKISRSLRPGKDANRALILLANSFIDGNLRQRIECLRRAKELAPESEIISYRLAVMLDMLGRSLNEITRDRIDTVRRGYEAVLKINPGNVSCLIGQGYLSWLVKDLDTAENAYGVADDLKDMVSQTFVGDLKYGLARVAAERAAQALEEAARSDLGDTKKSQRLMVAAAQVELARRSYAEAVTADPAVAACYDASTRVRNGYFSYICDAMLERYRQFNQELGDALEHGRRLSGAGGAGAGGAGGNSLLSLDSLETLRGYALNDYGAACINHYLRFDLSLNYVSPHRQTRLRDAVDALELATGGRRGNIPAPAQYNLAIAYAWRNQPLDSRRRVWLLKSVLRAFPNWLEAVRTNSITRIDHVLTLLQQKREELKDLEHRNQEEQALEKRRNAETATPQTLPGRSDDRSNSPRSQEIPNVPATKSTAVPSTQVTRVRRHIDMIARLLVSEQEDARKRIFDNTLLDSIKDDFELSHREISPSKSSTSQKIEHWDRLGDSEAFALSAWVQVLGRTAATESEAVARGANAPASSSNLIFLCKNLITQFYAEDYSLLQNLIFVLRRLPDPQGDQEPDYLAYEKTLLASFEREKILDPKSQLIRFTRNQYLRDGADRLYAKGLEQFEKKEYAQAVAFYSNACTRCPSNDQYHAALSLAFEQWERELLDVKNSSASPDTLKTLRVKALAELKRAAELNPDDTGYQERLVTLRMRQWVLEHGFEQALNAYQFSDRMEIQVSESLVNHLFNPDSTLRDGLQKRITELRDRLNRDVGVVLPGIKFRNGSFTDGECRFLIRDTPTAVGSCVGANDSEKWSGMVTLLEQVARSYAAEYFGPQDLIAAINKLARPQADFMRLLDHPGTLGAATIILKGLLSEHVSIVDLAAILSAIQTGTTAGVELLVIQEHLRSSPTMRGCLPGNDIKNPIRILRLEETLERELSRSIDTTWGAAMLNATPTDIDRWLGAVLLSLNRADTQRAVAIVTTADVRPFLRALTQIAFPKVPVLSDHEILTPFLVRIDGEIA